ncbi:hypothetical protein [Ornithinimicrobium kibberense]|uniref:hypothetical protein n=1 Tax=Ornithinimicrobium kibberense TaxID=282060 RepID=UPI0036244A9B
MVAGAGLVGHGTSSVKGRPARSPAFDVTLTLKEGSDRPGRRSRALRRCPSRGSGSSRGGCPPGPRSSRGTLPRSPPPGPAETRCRPPAPRAAARHGSRRHARRVSAS